MADTELDTRREATADAIIKSHMTYSALGGAIPVPLLDLGAVAAIQVDMLKQLAKTYDVELDARSTRTFVTAALTTLVGRAAARVGASLLKVVPVVGWAAGGVAQAAITASATYAVGRVFARLFREGRSLDTLTAESVRDELRAQFEEGKRIAAHWRREADEDAPEEQP